MPHHGTIFLILFLYKLIDSIQPPELGTLTIPRKELKTQKRSQQMVELDLKYNTINNTKEKKIQTIWFQSLFSNQYIMLPPITDLSAGSSHQNEVKESPYHPWRRKT